MKKIGLSGIALRIRGSSQNFSNNFNEVEAGQCVNVMSSWKKVERDLMIVYVDKGLFSVVQPRLILSGRQECFDITMTS